MGKFHEDGTLEIGGFGGLASDDSATKQDTDYLKAEIEHLKRLHSTLEMKTSFLTSRVKCLSKENERLSRGFSFVIVCTMILTVALIGCYVLVCNGLAQLDYAQDGYGTVSLSYAKAKKSAEQKGKGLEKQRPHKKAKAQIAQLSDVPLRQS